MDYQKPTKKKSEEKPSKEDLKIEKVVVGEVITRKKPLGSRIKDTFFGGDMTMVARYVSAEVLLPALRNLVADTIKEGADKLLYGDSSVPKRGNPGYSPSMTLGQSRSYTNYNRRLGNQAVVQSGYRSAQDRRGFEEIITANRKDALSILEAMQDIIDTYDCVSVADLKEMAGLKTTHVDNNWGWVYINDAELRQISSGYLISLPSPDEL